jgi:rhamnosyltransferase
MQEASWGVVVVSYNPEIKSFSKRIHRYLNQTSNVVIVNNGDSLAKTDFADQVVELGENLGIARAQNIGVQVLREKKVKFVFFLDQDSDLCDGFFYNMLDEWSRISERDATIGLLSPVIQDRTYHNISVPRAIRDGQVVKLSEPVTQFPVAQVMPISSGILTTVEIFDHAGGIDDALFIDWVDFQLDFNVMAAGYQTYYTNVAVIEHSIGKKQAHRFLNKKIYPTSHPLFREYYFTRNALIVGRQFSTLIPGLMKFVWRSIGIKYIFAFYEKNTIKRLVQLTKGIHDAHKYQR